MDGRIHNPLFVFVFCFFSYFLLGLFENPCNLKLNVHCLVLWKQITKLHKKQQT